jgi:N-acetylglucosamine-6-phosphate deacetylase
MAITRNANDPLLLRRANVVTPQGIIEAGNLLINEGYIKSLSRRAEDVGAHSGVILDLKDLILLPGFIDIHIHGAIGIDTMSASSDDLYHVGSFLARHGICGWLPTLVPAPVEDYNHAIAAIKHLIEEQDKRPPAARVLGIHYEGPFINSTKCGALKSSFFRKFSSRKDIEILPSIDGVARMITVAPEIEGGIELIKALVNQGWVVAIGHTEASVEILDAAREAGAKHMTHFFNAMAALHHRAPGPIGWGLLEDGITCDVIADGVHTHPRMLELAIRCKTVNRVILISDSIAPTGLEDGTYNVWGDEISVANGKTSNKAGTIAGSVITMLDAVKMIRSLNVPMEDVARLASYNAAQLLGLDAQTGTVDVGKRADLVALDKQGQVRLTIVGGRVAYNEI